MSLLRSRATSSVAAALVVALSLAVSGCSKSDGPTADEKTPEEVVALAKQTLDDTSGLHLTLSTKDLPDGVTGVAGAEGDATDAPAFDGKITVALAGNEFDVPVVAVDDKVYAQIPLTPGWSDVDPGDYGAPDPAQLVNADGGFSTMLASTKGLEKGSTVRGGPNNDEILTEYTGTVPGSSMKAIIPSASGDSFDTTYLITDGGELRSARLTGVFYPDSDSMTYTVEFDHYGSTKAIAAP